MDCLRGVDQAGLAVEYGPVAGTLLQQRYPADLQLHAIDQQQVGAGCAFDKAGAQLDKMGIFAGARQHGQIDIFTSDGFGNAAQIGHAGHHFQAWCSLSGKAGQQEAGDEQKTFHGNIPYKPAASWWLGGWALFVCRM